MIKLIKSKCTIYMFVCVFLALGIFVNFGINVSAATGTPYGKSITIQQILSDYQYFVNGNATLLNHNVGGVVAGGDVNISNFGDGAIAPSYLGNIISTGNYNGTSRSHFLSGNSSYSEYIGLPVYYNTTTVSGLSSSFTNYTNSTPFINLTSAFSTLNAQSTNMANSSYIVTQADITGDMYNGYTLNLPLSTYKSVVIPKAIYDQVNFIKLAGISSLNDFVNNEYAISVDGVSDISISFAYTSFTDSQNTGKKGILFSDGQSFNNSNSLKNISGGNLAGGQLNTNGMKLIWNFPNATTVTSDYTAGHIVAPNADVILTDGTGNFEGGIIAKSVVNNSAEGHFYPYMAIGVPYVTTQTDTPGNTPGDTPTDTSGDTPTDTSEGTPTVTPIPKQTPVDDSTNNISNGGTQQKSVNVHNTSDIRESGKPKTGDTSLTKFGLFYITLAIVSFSVAVFALHKRYSKKRKKK